MKIFLFCSAFLLASSVLAAPAEQPVVTVKPAEIFADLRLGDYGGPGMQMNLTLTAPDGMYLAALVPTSICCVSGDESVQYFALLNNGDSEGQALDFKGYSKTGTVWAYVECGFEHGGIGRMVGSVPVLVMPELRKLPPVEVALQSGAEVRSGEFVIRVIGIVHESRRNERSVELEISGPSPVAEVAVSGFDQSVCCFKKLMNGIVSLPPKGIVKQVCRVPLFDGMADGDSPHARIALHLPQGNGTVLNVPIDMKLDMNGVISAQYETAPGVHLAQVNQKLEDKEMHIYFETELPKGYSFASVSGRIPGSHVVLSDPTGKRIVDLSWEHEGMYARAYGEGAECTLSVRNIPLSPNLVYQGEFVLPIAADKDRSSLKEIELREGAEMQVGDYAVKMEEILRPSWRGEETKVVLLAIQGKQEVAGLLVEGKDGSLEEAHVYITPACAGHHFESRCRVLDVPPDQKKINVAVESWKDVQLYKVPVQGKLPLIEAR